MQTGGATGTNQGFDILGEADGTPVVGGVKISLVSTRMSSMTCSTMLLEGQIHTTSFVVADQEKI